MRSWKSALEKSLDKWRNRKNVEGALLTGSYATGTATEFSDLDLFIVLSDSARWNRKELHVVDGITVELSICTVSQFERYIDNEHREYKSVVSRMWSVGKIMFDRRGEIDRLQQKAKKQMRRSFKKLRKQGIEIEKAFIWNDLQDIKEMHREQASGFEFVCSLHLQRAITAYAKFLRAEIPPFAKLHRILSDKRFRARYGIEQLPDRQFNRLLKACLKKLSMRNIESLTEHVLEKMGGFDPDGWSWKWKTPAS
jgi:predicted nucleotidyltransferase